MGGVGLLKLSETSPCDQLPFSSCPHASQQTFRGSGLGGLETRAREASVEAGNAQLGDSKVEGL